MPAESDKKQYRLLESDRGSVGYEVQFRELMRLHPEKVKAIKELAAAAYSEIMGIKKERTTQAENNAVILTSPLYKDAARSRKDIDKKVEVIPRQAMTTSVVFEIIAELPEKTERFFLKIPYENEKFDYTPDVFHEFETVATIPKEVAEHIKKEWGAEFIQPLLALKDKEGSSYYLSEYLDLPLAWDICGLGELDGHTDSEEIALYDRTEAIAEYLTSLGYIDVSARNMFFDSKINKIIIFDLAKKVVPKTKAQTSA